MYYFGYGRNFLPSVTEERVGRKGITCKLAVLKGYRLEFNKYSTVVPDADFDVYGAVYDFTEEELQKMDSFEEYPNNYTRKLLPVQTNEGLLEAWVYFMTPEYTEENKGVKPSEDYVETIIAGAKHFAVPDDYMQKVKAAT